MKNQKNLFLSFYDEVICIKRNFRLIPPPQIKKNP